MAIVNPGNHSDQTLNPCNSKGPLIQSLASDPISPVCNDQEHGEDHVTGDDFDWLTRKCDEFTGHGSSGNCDPMQAGKIINDLDNPERGVIYRPSNAMRGCNEAMLQLFDGCVVLDSAGKAHRIPIIYGTQEDAVQFILQDNVRKDNSLVVDPIKLPMMAVYAKDLQLDQTKYLYHRAVDYLRHRRDDGKPGFTIEENGRDRGTILGVSRGIPLNITYNLVAWTTHLDDMDRLVEQIIQKFDPVAYIRVRGVLWETIVTLDSIANNIDFEPGDKKSRGIIKFQFSMTVKTFMPQPIVRKKAVLATRVEVVSGTDLTQATDLLSKLEQAVKELE